MRLPGINYNWQVTPFAKADVSAPIRIAGAKAQVAGAISSAAGSVAQVSGAMYAKDKRETAEAMEVKAMWDAEQTDFQYKQGQISQSDFESEWSTSNPPDRQYGAGEVVGVDYVGSETDKIAVDGEVLEVEATIPGYKVQAGLYERDALAALEVSASQIDDIEARSDFTHKGTLMIKENALKRELTGMAYARKYAADKLDADIQQSKDTNKFPKARLEIEMITDPVKKKIAIDDWQRDMELASVDEILSQKPGEKSVDAANIKLQQLRDPEYYDKMGGLNPDEKRIAIGQLDRFVYNASSENDALAKARNKLALDDIKDGTTTMFEGQNMSQARLTDLGKKAEALALDNPVAVRDFYDSIDNYKQFTQITDLPDEVALAMVEKIRDDSKTSMSHQAGGNAEKLDDAVNLSIEKKNNDILTWYDERNGETLTPLTYGEDRVATLNVRNKTVMGLFNRYGIYTGHMKPEEQAKYNQHINALSPEKQIEEAYKLLAGFGGKGSNAYAGFLAKEDKTGAFPTVMRMIAMGNEADALMIAKGSIIRANNPDVGTDYMQNANKWFGTYSEGAWNMHPEERGQMFNATLNHLASVMQVDEKGKPRKSQKFNQSEYKKIVQSYVESTTFIQGGKRVLKPSTMSPSSAYTKWGETIDQSEIDRQIGIQGFKIKESQANNPNVRLKVQSITLNMPSSKISKGIREGDLELRPYKNGFAIFNPETLNYLYNTEDKSASPKAFILEFDPNYTTRDEGDLARKREQMVKQANEYKALSPEDKKTVGEYGYNMDVLTMSEEDRKASGIFRKQPLMQSDPNFNM